MSALKQLQDEVESLIQKANETVKKSESAFDQVGSSVANGQGDVSINANGGGDVIKNKDKQKEKQEDINKEKSKEVEKEAKSKSEDEEKKKLEEEKKSKEAKEDKKEEKKEDEKVMKKSFEISEEDYEILQKSKAERLAKEAEEKALNDPLYKSISGLVSSLTSKLESLEGKLESISKSPAREPKSIQGYQAIAKSEGGNGKSFSKSEVLGVMEKLMKSNPDRVTPDHICEYEFAGSIQDKDVKQLVQTELNKQ